MAGIVVVGWRYHGVVASSHEHWLSPPVYLWQLSFVELVVRCWLGLVAMEAGLGGECQVLAKRLAGKNVSQMTSLVSSGL